MMLLSPVITKSGWIFGIAAPWQRGNDLIGYPMYYPHPQGLRKINDQNYYKFRRIVTVQDDPNKHPPYPAEPMIDSWACRIPKDQISHITDVISEFQIWLEEPDPRKSVLTRILREAAIPLDAIGIGGSTSLRCQQSDSDLDILIFGADFAAACIRSIEYVLMDGSAELMSHDIAAGYADRYGRLYGLTPEYLYHVFAQDLTKIYVAGKKISFIFSYAADEYHQIPELLYQAAPMKEVTFRARIVSISSWYYPRMYLVQISDGSLCTVWSHHWLHKALAIPGMLVEIVANHLDEKTYVLTKLHHRILPLHG